MRIPRAAAALAVLFLALCGTSAAQVELEVSLAGGGFLPRGELVRRIYGAGFAAAGDVWLKLKGPFGVAAGFGRLVDKGTAVAYFEGDVEEYPVKFRRQTLPVLLVYQLDLKGAALLAGAGVAIHSFRETWQTVDLDHKGSGAGPRFLLAARIGLLERLSLLGSVSYDSFRAGADSPNAADIDLGGFQICGGLSLRIY